MAIRGRPGRSVVLRGRFAASGFGLVSRRRREHIAPPTHRLAHPHQARPLRSLPPAPTHPQLLNSPDPAPRAYPLSLWLTQNINEPPQNIEAGSFKRATSNHRGGKPAHSYHHLLEVGSSKHRGGKLRQLGDQLRRRQAGWQLLAGFGLENPTCVLAGCVEDCLAEADRLADRSERSGRAR